jgi:hypothetical protein
MPYTAEDLGTWVKSLGLSEADQKIMLEKLGAESVLPKVGETILMRSEFAKKMDELKKEQSTLTADYESKRKKEDQFHASVAQWQTEEEKKMQAQITAAREDAEAKLSAASAKIRKLAETHAIPEDQIKDLLEAPAPRGNNNNAPDNTRELIRGLEGKFVSAAHLREETIAFAQLPGIISKHEREYYKLFGADAPDINWNDLVKKSSEEKRPLSAVFETTYKLAEKRTELAEAQHKKDIADAESRGAESARTKLLAEHPELASRTITRERTGSAILDQARLHAKQEPDKVVTQPRRD